MAHLNEVVRQGNQQGSSGEDAIYYNHRRRAIVKQLDKAELFGLKAGTIGSTVQQLRRMQNTRGSWGIPNETWEAVQTAVALQVLGKLGFSPSASWRTDEGSRGSIELSRGFLRETLSAPPQGFAGEDIWDTCQVLLALKAFGGGPQETEDAQTLLGNWQDRLRACRTGGWYGPGFLAALLDLCQAYTPDDKATREAILSKLLESRNAETGHFTSESTSPDVWHTAQVLQSLSRLPQANTNLELIASTCDVLLKARGDNPAAWYEQTHKELPIYTSRCLEALLAARGFLSGQRRENVDRTMREAGQWLEAEVAKGRLGNNLKALTTVSSYFSQLTVTLPAQLAFDLSSQGEGRQSLRQWLRGALTSFRTGVAVTVAIAILTATFKLGEAHERLQVRDSYRALKVEMAELSKENEALRKRVQELTTDHGPTPRPPESINLEDSMGSEVETLQTPEEKTE